MHVKPHPSVTHRAVPPPLAPSSKHVHHSTSSKRAKPPLHRHLSTAGSDFVLPTDPNLIDNQPFFYRIDSKPRWALLCLVTKGGSSMWKRALTRGLAEQGLPMLDGPGQWHGQPLPYNVSGHEVPISGIPRYMIVRHPLARLLSAYLGKAAKFFAYGWSVPYGWKPESGFRGFVNAIIAMNRSDLDPHFQLQVDQCGIPALRKAGVEKKLGYRYLKAEELGHWYRGVVCALGLTKAVTTQSHYWRDFYKDVPEFGTSIAPVEKRTLAYNQSIECFVRTKDCGCEIHCRGQHCNSSQVGTHPEASFASFNNATARLEDYYDAELAQRVNEWAADDLNEFGYEPWRPGGPLAPRNTMSRARTSRRLLR